MLTHSIQYKILPVVVVGCVVTDVTIDVVVPKYRLKIWSQYKYRMSDGKQICCFFFFLIFGLILLSIKTKYSKRRPFHDTCNSTIYNYWLHMKWTSNGVNPRVVVLLRIVAWRNTTSRGLKTGCWPYMNMNFLDNRPMNFPNQLGSIWNSALQRRWLKTNILSSRFLCVLPINIKCINFLEDNSMNIPIKLGSNWPQWFQRRFKTDNTLFDIFGLLVFFNVIPINKDIFNIL